MAFAPDGRRIAVGLGWGTIGIFDVETGAPVAHLNAPALRPVNQMTFSDDGNRLAAACPGEFVQVWDLVEVERYLDELGLSHGPRPAPPQRSGAGSL